MKEKEIVKFLATEVMGWGTTYVENEPRMDMEQLFYVTFDDNEWEDVVLHMPVDDFDPMNRIEHAFMVVEKMADWTFELHRDGDIWDCILANYPEAGSTEAESPTEAICITAARALGTDEQIREMGL